MFESLTEGLATRLLASNRRLAVAESCTGGWLSKVLTDQAGSSRWFERGFVTYSNAAKTDMLGVEASLIETQGAVSEAVVRAMAEGVLKYSQADISVAISGIAGPDGGSKEKPVGTVWFAWAQSAVVTQTRCVRFDGDRELVRQLAVGHALQGLVACWSE